MSGQTHFVLACLCDYQLSQVYLNVSVYFSPKSMGLLDPSTSDGRVIFFLPWEGVVAIAIVLYVDYVISCQELRLPAQQMLRLISQQIHILKRLTFSSSCRKSGTTLPQKYQVIHLIVSRKMFIVLCSSPWRRSGSLEWNSSSCS